LVAASRKPLFFCGGVQSSASKGHSFRKRMDDSNPFSFISPIEDANSGFVHPRFKLQTDEIDAEQGERESFRGEGRNLLPVEVQIMMWVVLTVNSTLSFSVDISAAQTVIAVPISSEPLPMGTPTCETDYTSRGKELQQRKVFLFFF